MESRFYENENGIIFNLSEKTKAIFFFKNAYPEQPVIFPIQKHTRNIAVYPNFDFSDGYDGIIIPNNLEVNIGVKTADCLPVIFYSDKVKGVIHAGWRGIVNGIFEELELKLKIFNERIENLLFVIGPHICGKCYEVKEDVKSIFEKLCAKKSIDKEKVIKTENGKLFIDLFSFVYETLKKKSEKIKVFHSGVCVKEDTRFFSRRRGDMISQPSCIIVENKLAR
ncbi:MAG: polyphenol oxidase family protein [Candidatus Calescibacterium sp.]|nr:polyphenol oxidase family protein [Candidatus Calescibacterium sp.]MCX7734333.1 polyphenol oxidase family protein [bacterium]MDW8087604.1 polyphenol oxidase family protein [Candidatus Calescibacterium sp.]